MRGSLARALRKERIDTLTAAEAGMIQQLDESHLQFASDQGRVLYSFNVSHYSRIHAEWMAAGKSHSGIILAKQQRYSTGEQLRRLLRLMDARSAERMRNSLESSAIGISPS